MPPALDSRRSQPLRRGAVCVVGAAERASVSIFSADVSRLWFAASHADGPRIAVVVHMERMGIDVAFGAAEGAGNTAALRAGAPSADTRKSGAIPSHAGRS